MATVMLVHYLLSTTCRCTDEQLKVRPVLTMANGKVPAAEKLNTTLKAMAQRHGVDPDGVSLHGLRTGRCSDFVNGVLINNPVGLLATTSHSSLRSIDPYIRMQVGLAEQVTRASRF